MRDLVAFVQVHQEAALARHVRDLSRGEKEKAGSGGNFRPKRRPNPCGKREGGWGGRLSDYSTVPRKVWPSHRESLSQSHPLQELRVLPDGPASVPLVCSVRAQYPRGGPWEAWLQREHVHGARRAIAGAPRAGAPSVMSSWPSQSAPRAHSSTSPCGGGSSISMVSQVRVPGGNLMEQITAPIAASGLGAAAGTRPLPSSSGNSPALTSAITLLPGWLMCLICPQEA